jgi:hypothetical protein
MLIRYMEGKERNPAYRLTWRFEHEDDPVS